MAKDSKINQGLSFVVAAYNEEGAIFQTLEALSKTLSSLSLPWEIIVVNDGSSDRTKSEVLRLAGVRLLDYPQNLGYGTALKSGFLAAKYDWVGIIDADGTYPVEKIPDLVSQMEKGFDMVVASRKNIRKIDGIFKWIWRWVFVKVIKLLNDSRIQDPNSGLRIVKKEPVIRLFPFLGGSFSFTTSLTILLSGLSYCIGYVPVEYHKRTGFTKVRHLRDSLRTILYITQGVIFFNPLKFFIILAFFLGFFVFIPAALLILFSHPRLAFYFTVFGTSAVFLIAMGALGDIVKTSAGRRFYS
jgi:polyisoprenyl-phosphate glycosyltransferase